MGFKINYDENVKPISYEIVAEGKYEVTILAAEVKEFNGSYSIGFDVEIRSDVDQAFQGSKVLYNSLYLSPGIPDYEDNRKAKVNSFLNAFGRGGQKNLDASEFAQEIQGKTALAYVKHKKPNAEGKVFPHVTFVAESKVNPPQHSGPSFTVGDDDLPF
ncbi:DUF669 domain-containing protein [Sporosarcina newyorkensis]|uniref:DUF669 domain-containing protein n=1 Tax=Sporosarcina newyorkensis TaxID=759851 RepID=UPI003CFE8430